MGAIKLVSFVSVRVFEWGYTMQKGFRGLAFWEANLGLPLY